MIYYFIKQKILYLKLVGYKWEIGWFLGFFWINYAIFRKLFK